MDGTYFDHQSIALDIAFIESLTLTKSTKSGKPEPFRLLPAHKKLVTNLLGWKRADGTRMYRKCYFLHASMSLWPRRIFPTKPDPVLCLVPQIKTDRQLQAASRIAVD
jgi:hypothetical protein